jgi:hypothetical protein
MLDSVMVPSMSVRTSLAFCSSRKMEKGTSTWTDSTTKSPSLWPGCWGTFWYFDLRMNAWRFCIMDWLNKLDLFCDGFVLSLLRIKANWTFL